MFGVGVQFGLLPVTRAPLFSGENDTRSVPDTDVTPQRKSNCTVTRYASNVTIEIFWNFNSPNLPKGAIIVICQL